MNTNTYLRVLSGMLGVGGIEKVARGGGGGAVNNADIRARQARRRAEAQRKASQNQAIQRGMNRPGVPPATKTVETAKMDNDIRQSAQTQAAAQTPSFNPAAIGENYNAPATPAAPPAPVTGMNPGYLQSPTKPVPAQMLSQPAVDKMMSTADAVAQKSGTPSSQVVQKPSQSRMDAINDAVADKPQMGPPSIYGGIPGGWAELVKAPSTPRGIMLGDYRPDRGCSRYLDWMLDKGRKAVPAINKLKSAWNDFKERSNRPAPTRPELRQQAWDQMQSLDKARGYYMPSEYPYNREYADAYDAYKALGGLERGDLPANAGRSAQYLLNPQESERVTDGRYRSAYRSAADALNHLRNTQGGGYVGPWY